MTKSVALMIILITASTQTIFAAANTASEKSAAQEPRATSGTKAAPGAMAVPEPAAGQPSERATADAVMYAATLQAVTEVSERAIEAAHHASTEATELFEKLIWLTGGLGVIFAIFGVSSIRSLKREVAAQAKDRVNAALVEVNAKAKEQVAKALEDMKSQIDTAIVHTAEIAENARDLLLNVAEATRYFALAEAFAEAPIDKQEYFQSAVNSCLRAREAAQKLGDTKQIA